MGDFAPLQRCGAQHAFADWGQHGQMLDEATARSDHAWVSCIMWQGLAG